MTYTSALCFGVLLALIATTGATGSTVPNFNCYFVRQYDGTCNNFLNPEWGSRDSYLLRGAEGVWFADGVREPIKTPNARTVSNDLFRGDETVLSPHGHNIAWTFFGQFIAHDILGVHRRGDNETEIGQEDDPNVYILIPIEQPNDSFKSLVPPLTKNYTRVLRSRGDFVNGRFEVGSDSTSFLDLDVVYGKTAAVNNLLRTHVDGLLVSKDYFNYTTLPGVNSNVDLSFVGNFPNWMPLMKDVEPDLAHPTIPISSQSFPATTINVPARYFATGDGRSQENYGLQMFQGLFFRNHNRLARQIKEDNPWWNDEMIFQHARKLNIGMYQNIVLYEYLEALLLDDWSQIGHYHGYNPFTNPTVNHLMAFALRFGHTTVPSQWSLRDACGQPAFNSSRDGPRTSQSGRQQMPADQMALVGKPENIIHAMLFQKSGAIDPQFPESLRTVRGANIDTIANNQLRAADNGVPGYHYIRKLYHGGNSADLYTRPSCAPATETSPAPDPIGCFNYINSNITIATTLRNLYGKITNINYYTSVVSEEPTKSAVGRTAARVIADFFKRVRDGDRWWFEGEWANLSNKELREVKNTQLHDLLRANFPSLNVQNNAFYVPKQNSFFEGCQAKL